MTACHGAAQVVTYRGILAGVEATRPDPSLAIDLAYLGGAIERWAGDLALAEEPSRFLVALESLGFAPTPAESSR
jgi:hypothetical protein